MEFIGKSLSEPKKADQFEKCSSFVKNQDSFTKYDYQHLFKLKDFEISKYCPILVKIILCYFEVKILDFEILSMASNIICSRA